MVETERSPAYFAVIPYPVLVDQTLADKAKLLYAEISALAQEEGYCWATNAHLADRLKCGERTVSRWLAQLQDLGFISVETVGAKGIKGNRERRIFVGAHVKNSIAKTGSTATNGESSIATNGETVNNVGDIHTEYTPYSPPRSTHVKSAGHHKPERFDGLWVYYRDHTGRYRDKSKALEQWDKLKPDDALIARMGKALEAQLATEQGKRGIGFPELFRWLRDKRWEELPPATVQRADQLEEYKEVYGWR